jgi:hypothetical protein
MINSLSFYEAYITLIPKQDNIKESNRPVSLMNVDIKSSIKSQNMISDITLIYHGQVAFILGIQGWSNTHKSINVINYITNEG